MRVVWMFFVGALMALETFAAQPPSVMLEKS